MSMAELHLLWDMHRPREEQSGMSQDEIDELLEILRTERGK
jgi:hypothetical protein